MNKTILSLSIAGALTLAVSAAAPVCAQAATIEEALDYARSLGWPEELLMQAANSYYESPELYPPEELDRMMSQLDAFKGDLVPGVPHDPDAPVPSVPEPEQPDAPDDSITLTMPDGSTFTRISRQQFIAMSYEDKQTYLSTFTPEQQEVFINDLSPEEYRSLMKQLPADKKADILNDMSAFTDSLNLTLSVDEITADDLSFSIKNDRGELLGAGSAKDRVESTGYDRRGILALAGSLIASGIAGVFLLAKKIF